MEANHTYFRLHNLYFVPIIQNKLSFCILVKRAFAELQLGPQDLVAVELPDSIRTQYFKNITKLPEISLLLSKYDNVDTSEVFSISPNNGIVEAIRKAEEGSVPIAFIDHELTPKILENRQCIPDTRWPDCDWVLKKGIDWYMSVISGHLLVPPARSDPTDSWREAFMADRLREYMVWYKRILVICDMVHMQPVIELLSGSPANDLALNYDSPALSVRVMKPSLPECLRILGEIPRLVESFERKRNSGKDFTALTEILKIVHELVDSARDMNLSIRNFQAFSLLITKMCESQGRVSPTLQNIRQAGVTCFNEAFGERIFRHLLGYFNQLKVSRIVSAKGVSSNRTIIYEIRGKAQHTTEHYVGRNCDQNANSYVAAPPLPPLPDYDGYSTALETVAWPLSDQFVDSMRRKAQRVVKQEKIIAKTLPFRGSIESGLDLRRTLRSQLSHQPELYVRQVKRRQKYDVNLLIEPTVWIFDTSREGLEDYSFTCGTVQSHVLDWRFSKYYEELQGSDNVYIYHERNRGFVTFANLTSTASELKNTFGSILPERIPSLADFDKPILIDDVYEFAPYKLDEQDLGRDSWWEALIMAGLLYSSERIAVVAPADLKIPSNIIKFAEWSKKKIERIRLESFDLDERRLLAGQYWIEAEFRSPKDSNDPVFHNYLIEKYGQIMAEYWGRQ